MTNWTKSHSSLELLESLKEDVVVAQRSPSFDAFAIDWSASLEAIDALIERLESLPNPQEQSND